MKAFVMIFGRVSGFMNVLAGVTLFCMMLLTTLDVALRLFGSAILGTYELVAVSGAIVAGFAMPQTSLDRGNVSVDFLLERAGEAVRTGIFVCTRIMGIALFSVLCVYLYRKGVHLYKVGEVSLTLHLPFYPAAFGLSFCMFMECFALVVDFLKISLGEDDR